MVDKKRTYLTRAARHYNKLFTFPKYWQILVLHLLVSQSGSIISFSLIQPDFQGILRGGLFALKVFFLPTVIIDVVSRKIFTRADPIFDLRRSAALSLVSSFGGIIILAIGSIMQAFFSGSQSLYIFTFFGICIITAMRFLVLSTITRLSHSKLFLATIGYPFFLFSSNIFFWRTWSIQIIIASIISCAILIIATQVLILIVNRQGEVIVGIGAISLFKGFIANWLVDLKDPLETYFEKLGIETQVSINIFTFKSKNKIKAIIAIPNIHPGPFRNLGSSDLPGMIQRSLDKKFATITAVPHGISDHELDLTSQFQCEKVIKKILCFEPKNFFAKASKAIRVDTGSAQASCQFFGETALVTVTCAPKRMEDIPLEIGEKIMRKYNELGVIDAAIIDTHNSIGKSEEVPSLSETESQYLVSAAEKAVKCAINEEQHPLLVGVAKVVPKEFSIGQGVGSGGIIALAIIVDGQKTLYVTIDGNNMISGLREKIIQSLSNHFDESEVFTTDTHIVSAINTMKRGYYAVGEAIDHERLISFIKNVAIKAMNSAEEVEVSFTRVPVNNVRIIGKAKLVNISILIDRTINLIKWIAPLIYIPTIISAIIPFYLIR